MLFIYGEKCMRDDGWFPSHIHIDNSLIIYVTYKINLVVKNQIMPGYAMWT